MRRFVTLSVLLLFSIPFGVSVSGCSKTAAPIFCNGGDSGVTTGQATTIVLQPQIYGISLNYAEIGQLNNPTTTDCKGSTVSVNAYTYGTSNMAIADIQPNTGRLCGGTWNRNSGGGIPDFTYCTPTSASGTAYITASAEGVTSNAVPVFVHPVVTSIVLGGASTNCTTDPTTACCPLAVDAITAPAYPINSCLSQGKTAQLVARIYAGTGTNQTNISCLAGHLQYSATGSSSTVSISPVVSIDQNGVATAEQPGSVLISANLSNAASSAGFFSTCPPASITLTAPGSATPGTPSSPVVINQNNTQALTATVVDTLGVTLQNLTLEFVSTAPTTIPTTSNDVIPPLAGAASISAICQPPSCNSSAYNQIGLFGNGKPIVSNSVNITAPGTNSTVLYMASTQSMYVETRDFTQTAMAAPFLLPYLPNSMVITNDGSLIYMGSSSGLMVLNAVNTLAISRTDITSPGTVLAVSPDGSMIILSDPVKGTTTLQTSSGAIISTYGGVGTHAEFAPDSQTVYVAAGNQVLVYSENTGWTNISPATPLATPVTDVAITIPSVGAYFAGPSTTARGYCASSTAATVGGVTTETNVFYPPANDTSAATVYTDRIAATNDGMHILGATVAVSPQLTDLRVEIPAGNANGPSVSIACPMGTQTTNSSGVTSGVTGGLTFSSTPYPIPLSQIAATGITGILPTSDSSIAFITYSGSGGVLPAYAPASSGPGIASYIRLSGSAVAPVAGVLSADNTTFYAGTTGDNLVHLITRGTLTDASTLAPNLVNPAGSAVPVNLLVQKPRKTT